MNVEILTKFQHKGNDYHKGEVRIVDDAAGEYFCRAGWARDTSGTIPTATPSTSEVVLEVQDASSVNKVSEVI